MKCFWAISLGQNAYEIQRPESSRLSSNSTQSIRFGFGAKVTDKRENFSEILSDLFILLRNLV